MPWGDPTSAEKLIVTSGARLESGDQRRSWRPKSGTGRAASSERAVLGRVEQHRAERDAGHGESHR